MPVISISISLPHPVRFRTLSQSAFSPTNTNLTLKRPIPDPVCDHDKYERADDKSKIYLPAEFDPRTVVHSTHGQLDEGASRPEAVCNAVAILVSKHEHLLIDVQYLSERLQYRHDDDCLSTSRNHQEVKQCHKHKDDQEREDCASVFKEL